MSLDGSMRGGRRPSYPPSGLSSLEGSMRGGLRPSYQSVRALFEQAEEAEGGGAARPGPASPPLPACPSPSQQPCQQPPLALLERLSSRAPVPGLERHSFQGGGLRGGLPLVSREASRACSIEGSFRGGLRCWSGEGLDQLAAAGGWALPAQPRPVLAYTGRHHALLDRRCQEALSILDRVQRPAPLRRGAPATGGSLTPQLPKTAFRFAKGLVFVSNQRAGALAGYSWGHGVLIARLPGGGWSAPLLLCQRSGSLGLLLGWQRVEACHVLQTDDQVQAFAVRHSQGMELGAEQGEPDAGQQPKHKDGGAVRLTGACSATLADGVFWDVSVRAGCTFVDDRLNASLYGDGVTAAEILGGRVALPEEFLPLYQAVDALAAEAQTTRPTLSKFSLVRQQSRQQQQGQAQARQLARQLSNGSASSTGSGAPGPSLLQRVRASFRRRSGSGSSARGCDSPILHDRGWRRSVSSATASDPASGAGGAGSPGPSEEPSTDFKLFGGVSIDFEERFTYEAQEAAEAAAEAEERRQAEADADVGAVEAPNV